MHRTTRKATPKKHPVLRAGARRVRARADWHWFDHPEMQARIAEAEADRREGRVKTFDSRAAALAYLRGSE